MAHYYRRLVFGAEALVSIGYTALLHRTRDRYEPNWTWLTVVGGTILSTTPAITLARQRHTRHWRDYERDMIAGFCVSGAVIIAWQLWLVAQRLGQHDGYTRRGIHHANPTTPLEYTTRRSAHWDAGGC